MTLQIGQTVLLDDALVEVVDLGPETYGDGILLAGKREVEVRLHDESTRTVLAEALTIPRRWSHARKGMIQGIEVGGDAEWLRIRLIGDHELRYASTSNRGRIDEDGEILTVRRTLVREVA